jgi:hypothetical protein
LHWADSILKAYPNRRAIISSHWIINADASWGAQGQAIYNRLKNNANLFLMLCGHINPNGEARRADTYNGHTVNTLLSDYQDRTNGGNGWMRFMTFSPGQNKIFVKTYSPTLNHYQMSNIWDTIGIVKNVVSGGSPSVTWNGLDSGHRYDWYVIISDSFDVTTSAIKTFTFKTMPDTTDTTSNIGMINHGIPLEIYPNPNSGKNVMISYDKAVPADVMIVDINGRKIFNNRMVLGKSVKLPVRLETGSYFIIIQTEYKKITKKLVVQ